jgi:phage shock protein PspC (stress-responsive transcriptional regulator)
VSIRGISGYFPIGCGDQFWQSEVMEPTQEQAVPPPPVPRPRLERPRDDRAIAGVASGVARYLGIDVAWVRIGFVVTALFGGTGILLYLIGWVALPEEGARESIAVEKAHGFEGAGSWIGIGLIVLAALIVVGNTSFIDGDLLFAAALIVVGVLLYRGDFRRTSGERAGQAEPPPAAAPAGSLDEETLFVETAVDDEPPAPPIPSPPAAPPAPPPAPAFQPRPPRPERKRSPLGRLGLAATLIVVGIMGVGQSADWWSPNLRHYAAAILVVLGATLLVSSVFGRARWLIVVGLLLAPLLIAMALLKVPFEGGFGDPRFEPQTLDEVSREYRLMAGEMVLDLSNLELEAGQVATVDASVVFGRLEVIVPMDLGVDVVARVDAGGMYLDRSRGGTSGFEQSDNINVERTIEYSGIGLVILDAHVGFGELNVHQIAEAAR